MKPKSTVKKTKLSILKSRFDLLEDEFDDIILKINEWDQTGRSSDAGITRKKYIFKDESFLSITEHFTKDGFISYYNYDWYTKKQKIIQKFHSEPHKDKKKQTKTEPYHIHRISIEEEIREPNYNLRELYDILDYIASKVK